MPAAVSAGVVRFTVFYELWLACSYSTGGTTAVNTKMITPPFRQRAKLRPLVPFPSLSPIPQLPPKLTGTEMPKAELLEALQQHL